MTTPDDPRPLHQRIAADLRDEILSGQLPPESRLPSTAQLTERFGAANATVQKALGLLKDEGLVVGRAGAHITVREHRQRAIRPADYLPPAGPGQPYPWISQAAEQGLRGRSELLEVAEVSPPAEVADALGLGHGGRVILRRQVLLLDDEPADYVRSYYPAVIARNTELAVRRRIPGGTPALLAGLGHPPRRCLDRVSARIPTQDEYAVLRLPGELPVLRTFRVVFSDDDAPIEATIMAKAGHLFELRYDVS